MKSKTVPVLFLLAGALIAGIFLYNTRFAKKQESTVNKAKIVTPKSAQSDDSETTREVESSSDKGTFDSLIPLKSTETLIGTLVLDLNLDAYDDEVIVVRKSGSQFLHIVAGVYNQDTMSYERIAEIPTEISKTRTFSYTGMDIIGDHSNALVYQGDDDNGNYVMKIFLFQKDKNDIIEIGDFSSDGTIFIQQTERSESYELSLSKGESFSVWVYKSDKPETNSEKGKSVGVNQLQQEYKWNATAEHYELSNEIHVNANRLAAKELSRIQDGTIETFASFLDGLWYKISNDGSVIRYMYFDYASKEIIQVYGDIQEVYEWEDSKLRHNGIYLTTVNSSISTLHRRFDVALANVDEIKITIHDDINLIIKENTLWDGNYKKMSLQSSTNQQKTVTELEQIVSELKKNDIWTSADTLSTISAEGIKYTFATDGISETGVFSPLQAGNYNILEFMSDTDNSMLNEMYSVKFGKKTITEKIKKKTVEKTVTDTDTLIFIPVKITPTDCFEVEGKSFTFQRGKND